METKFQTSFIPKQPVTETAHRASSSGLIFLISLILFVASIAAAAGAFLYNDYIDKSIVEGNAQLKRNEQALDPTTIQGLTRLNDRINSATTLLDKHVAVSRLFAVLSDATLQNVRFNDFTYANAGGDKVNISMKGQATSYETVALQSKSFTDPSRKNVFKSPLFGDLNLDQSGNVTFSFSASIDPSLVSYSKNIKERASRNNQPATTSPATTR